MRSARATSLAAAGLGAVLAVALALAFARADEHEPARIAAYADTLPAGPGREIATQSCLLCHTASLLTQQRKDSTAWAKTVAQMEKWDAPVAPEQRDSLIAYLVGSLGPRPAAR